MPVFIGLDLAWTPRHETGICVLEGDGEHTRLVQLDCRTDTPERFAQFCDSFGPDVVAAVDAPLLLSPSRKAEGELAREFGRFKAGAYSANLPFLQRMDGLAGPELAKLLGNLGFVLAPSALTFRARGRFALEVFPHPAHVVLFGLAERIAYKKGALARRRVGLRLYQQLLGALLASEMPNVSKSPRIVAVLAADAVEVPGRELKRLEDQLDAITCAYVAYHCWDLGPERFRAFGCDEHGAIVTPWPIRPATCGPGQSSP
ncbi:MAG: DUF429 domain-containing protein [Tepidiformaceae bacterium]